MKRGLIACVFSTLLLAQKIQQKPNEAPPQASFGLQDPSLIQRLPESKPDAKLSGVIPRLADGKPDLSGPWQPNAIRENVNLIAAGSRFRFCPTRKRCMILASVFWAKTTPKPAAFLRGFRV